MPEGTAAKKLQHHQSIAPPDPRTLNPAIPDDVAAVLARMMAKDPRDRYQLPEQLVHDLRSLLKRLEPIADAPGTAEPAALWADAPLPAATARWPLMATAAAILGVVVLVAVIEMTRPAAGPGFRIALPGPRAAVEIPADTPAAATENRAKTVRHRFRRLRHRGVLAQFALQRGHRTISDSARNNQVECFQIIVHV